MQGLLSCRHTALGGGGEPASAGRGGEGRGRQGSACMPRVHWGCMLGGVLGGAGRAEGNAGGHRKPVGLR